MNRQEAIDKHFDTLFSLKNNTARLEYQRWAAKNDLFYLLVAVLGRKDLNRDWLYDRVREVEASPDGHLDLWFREAGKSSIITFGLTIRDILNDPEITVGIFSYSRPIAKAFLRQIKYEFEANEHLRSLFPDILWENPHRDAPKWSEDDGIIVKRAGNPKESTVEAWGLVDGQPTSRHYRLMVYDDVVTAESVTTPEMIKKVTTAWETSRNLTTEGGRTRYIGTRWSYNDTYREMLARGAAIERRHPVTADGTVEGEPVLWTRERVAEKRREMGPYSFSSQLLLDPAADRSQGFRDEWLRFYDNLGFGGLNKYLLVDAANEKNKRSDYTAAVVIGLGNDDNYYLLDMVRDRLNLTERAEMVFLMHRRWKPLRVGYEKYGLMADIEHIQDRMGRETYHFDIVELGGRMGKNERIKRLVPIFEAGRFWFPESLNKVNYEKRMVDLIKAFIDEEYKAFPVGIHDDMLDAMSRITDEEMTVAWPRQRDEGDRYTRRRERFRVYSSWAA
jgi:predicted phage terminase large subunit-like protein